MMVTIKTGMGEFHVSNRCEDGLPEMRLNGRPTGPLGPDDARLKGRMLAAMHELAVAIAGGKR